MHEPQHSSYTDFYLMHSHRELPIGSPKETGNQSYADPNPTFFTIRSLFRLSNDYRDVLYFRLSYVSSDLINSGVLPSVPTGTLSSGQGPLILDTSIPNSILLQPLVSEPGHIADLSESLFHNMPNPPIISPPSPENTDAAIGDNSSTSQLESRNMSQSDINTLLERIDRLEELIRRSHSGSSSTVGLPPLSPPPVSPGRSRRSRWTRSASGNSTPLRPELTTVTSYELLKPPISRTTINDKIKFTAMSANGQKLALLTEEVFRIFDTKSPIRHVCMGQFVDKGTHFKYSHQGEEMKSQVPLPVEKFEIAKFSCVAMSNEYLAIGCKGRMMIFIIDGEHVGRWICYAIHDPTTWMEKLEFSADGRTLVALLRSQSGTISGSQSKALMYSTENIQKEDIERQTPVPPIPEVAPTRKRDWEFDTPTHVGFSGDRFTTLSQFNLTRTKWTGEM